MNARYVLISIFVVVFIIAFVHLKYNALVTTPELIEKHTPNYELDFSKSDKLITKTNLTDEQLKLQETQGCIACHPEFFKDKQ